MGDHGADRRLAMRTGYGDGVSLAGDLSEYLCPFINYVSVILEVIEKRALFWDGRGIYHHYPVAFGRIGKQCGQRIYIIFIDDVASLFLKCSGRGLSVRS